VKNFSQPKAEERFARIRNKNQDKSAFKQAVKEREKADTEREAKILRLRALRLAKEAADKAAADQATADEKAARPRKTVPPDTESSS
jgi:hypothetical protein